MPLSMVISQESGRLAASRREDRNRPSTGRTRSRNPPANSLVPIVRGAGGCCGRPEHSRYRVRRPREDPALGLQRRRNCAPGLRPRADHLP
jgi:hypothetical protein